MKHTVTKHVLDSGAKGLFVHVPGSPVYNLVIRFNSGFQFGDFKRYELPHVLEHLISRGTIKHPQPNEFVIEVTKNGAMRNAMTSSRVNGYITECAAFEFDRILDLFEEYMTEPTFPAEALPTEISNVSEELGRSVTNHDASMGNALLTAAFPDSHMLYEQRIEQLSGITRDEILAYHRRTHTAANGRFYVAGDLTKTMAENVLVRLDRMFAKLPTGERLKYIERPGRLVEAPVVLQRDIKQLYYACEVYSGGITDQEDRALRILRVILFGGFASRVYGEARRRGLAYHISGDTSGSVDASSFGFSGNVSWDHADDLFELAVNQILAIRDHGVTQAELDAALNLAIGSMDRSYQTAGQMLSFYMSHYDSDEIIDDFDGEHTHLRALTVDDIKAAANIVKPGVNHAVSLLGEVSEAKATSLEAILARLWQ